MLQVVLPVVGQLELVCIGVCGWVGVDPPCQCCLVVCGHVGILARGLADTVSPSLVGLHCSRCGRLLIRWVTDAHSPRACSGDNVNPVKHDTLHAARDNSSHNARPITKHRKRKRETEAVQRYLNRSLSHFPRCALATTTTIFPSLSFGLRFTSSGTTILQVKIGGFVLKTGSNSPSFLSLQNGVRVRVQHWHSGDGVFVLARIPGWCTCWDCHALLRLLQTECSLE